MYRYIPKKPKVAKAPLSDESKARQKELARSYMVIRFHDNNTWSHWSNEHTEKHKLGNMNDSLNEQFRLFDKYFRKNAASAAIFDTRESKKVGAHNKLFQFENGSWKIVQEFHL